MSQAQLSVVFMGTPPFAAHILNKIISAPFCKVSAVYCQPDRPAGRGKKLMPPAVKVLAEEHGITVHQPLNFKNVEDITTLAEFKPHVLVVAAYGLLLPQAVLDIPSIAPINVHGSLLPLYRGAAPIQRAIMDGHKETGVAIMQMEKGLDSGPVYASSRVEVGEHTAASMHDLLADVGADALLEILQRMAAGEQVEAVPQDHTAFTHAAKLSKQDGLINWSQSAAKVHAHIRAVTSWPAAQARILRPEKDFCDIKFTPGRIGPHIATYVANLAYEQKMPELGEIWRLSDGSIAIATQDDWYVLGMVRPQGKGEMSAEAFANGYLEKGQGKLAAVDMSFMACE